MTKEVEIIINGVSLEEADAADNSVETRNKAEYFARNGFHYVTYEDQMEGVDTSIKNWIKFREDYFELRKSGALSSQLTFQEGKIYMTNYKTPYGNMIMGVNTHKLDFHETEDKIVVEIRYDLEADEQLVAKMQLQIEIRKGL